MEGNSATPRKAQLDKEEREHLEDIVTEMRERVEANVRYQLEEYDLEERPEEDSSLSDEEEDLVEAIELEAVDGNEWDEGYEQYITGVGYTIVNRLAALRCMEVRNFIDDEVTRFREDGLTPAADRLVTEEFMLEEEAVLEAYRNACDALAEEIEILFDRSSAYSLIDPDDDTYKDLCGMLDEVSDEVWRADDVLGWVYEYYNVKLLDDLRRKGDREGLEPEDVPAANQFYTPHWVVRMLTDNSLGKLYLEYRGELQDTVERQDSMSSDERKNRQFSPDDSPDIADFCTYLVPSEEEGEPPEFDSPEDIRVIDPACGSGHFLLYAFDVLERIYRAETDLDHAEIPREILRNNLYGVDLDMRACQLAAFNLYLKGRTRAEAEGASGFDMPEVGIVCADAKVADIEGVEEVFDEVAEGKSDVENALRRILDAFEEVHGLGSLLDVRGTLGDLFEDEVDKGSVQIKLDDDPREDHTLGQILHSLREAVDHHREDDSFLAQDLRSFVRLLDVLAQDYDVALMNPPYGTENKMPDVVEEYIREHYRYKPEFYVNFFEVCNKIVKPRGRVGMIVPRTFMFKKTFEDFRSEFIGDRGSFDFLAEYGMGVLDNATVRTAGTVVRIEQEQSKEADFYRLHDVGKELKEERFIASAFTEGRDNGVKRHYNRDISEFSIIPGSPLSYWVPLKIREIYKSDICFDAENSPAKKESMGTVKVGLQTGNNSRFLRRFWEIEDYDEWVPFAKGGSDAWILPRVNYVTNWGERGREIKRYEGSYPRSERYYFRDALTYTNIKEGGRRFGYLHDSSIFGTAGQAFLPDTDIWEALAYSNSDLVTYLMLALTTGRHWQAGEVSRLPWDPNLSDSEELETYAKEILAELLRERRHEFNSVYYQSPILLSLIGYENPTFVGDHPHRELLENIDSIGYIDSYDATASLYELGITAAKYRATISNRLENKQQKINDYLFQHFGIEDSLVSDILLEIALRTNEDPRKTEEYDPEEISEPSEDFQRDVKDLIQHFALEAIHEEDDGIIPMEGTDEQDDMLDRIIERFEEAYGENADDRLVEVDDILGAKSAADEAYPNLRTFIEDDLFAYHVDTMENKPIFWKLSSERLLADSSGEGFACFVDYHKIDASLFDRLSNQYLEPRKAELRERRSGANQRRNDESLSTSERAEASEEFEFCSSALEQIAEFEEVMQALGSTSDRDFNTDDRELVSDLAPKVAAFREETANRIEILTKLYERNGEDWFRETFSGGFWSTVDEWSEEWLEALNGLEQACEAYARPSDEPVEAHLADLFEYFSGRIKGSDHYSSTGILFMTYYFEREGANFLNEDGEPFENLTEDERMLASLATGVDDPSIINEEYLEQVADDEDVDDVDDLPPLAEFKALAEEIDDRCQTIDKQIPSDWSDRALSEITTAGYQPNQKHGVAINITPLAEKNIVPEIVGDKVL
ncbi:BREX-5 system adenine-specific DNA-methyltransferase PglX [Halovenus marina]|uniref:BREX-5 system adenine-specific DNA-methyltransferase PglX n=1 Tax=Halovenus marina TaxID=3396621 RepID=UPI003F566F04